MENLNTRIVSKHKANYFRDALTAVPGSITIGDKGIQFDATVGPFFIQIPYPVMKGILVQKPFGVFYNGIIIDTTDGQSFRFVTTKTKELLTELSKKKLPLYYKKKRK